MAVSLGADPPRGADAVKPEPDGGKEQDVIHDARVEVTCDADCGSSVIYDPPYVYRDMGGGGGHYDVDDEKIERWLVKSEEWVVRGGKHFCCAECADGT